MKEYGVMFFYSCYIEADSREEATAEAEKMLRERMIRTDDLLIKVAGRRKRR